MTKGKVIEVTDVETKILLETLNRIRDRIQGQGYFENKKLEIGYSPSVVGVPALMIPFYCIKEARAKKLLGVTIGRDNVFFRINAEINEMPSGRETKCSAADVPEDVKDIIKEELHSYAETLGVTVKFSVP